VATGSIQTGISGTTETTLRELVERATQIESRLEALSTLESRDPGALQRATIDDATKATLEDLVQQMSALDSRMEHIGFAIDRLPASSDVASTVEPSTD